VTHWEGILNSLQGYKLVFKMIRAENSISLPS